MSIPNCLHPCRLDPPNSVWAAYPYISIQPKTPQGHKASICDINMHVIQTCPIHILFYPHKKQTVEMMASTSTNISS